jgi:quercetin dioxygenase-like cupin family protein
MAVFQLEPGEAQEHSHERETTTILVDGAADLFMHGRRQRLDKGVVVRIPPNTSHTVVNTGETVATIGCRCVLPEPPSVID